MKTIEMMKRITFLLLLLAVSCCQTMGMRPSNIESRNFRSSVFVVGTNHILTEDMTHWGTAFLVDSSGTMVTANHVVKDLLSVNQARRMKQPTEAAYICVTVYEVGTKENRSWTIPVDVVMQREDKDIAILRPSSSSWGTLEPPHWQPFEIDSQKELLVGEPVIIVGYPIVAPYTAEELRSFSSKDILTMAFSQRIDPIVTPAVVSGHSRSLIPEALQTSNTHENIKQVFLLLDHSSAPGNSGGPVISQTTGKVVGMQARTNAFGYSFAVTGADLKESLEKYYTRERQDQFRTGTTAH